MSIWVKICANTTLQDARMAAEAGADAVGFVFAPSPRRVALEQVAAIVPHLPANLEKIGVFVDAAFGEIAAAVEGCGLTGVQLYSEAMGELVGRLRARFGAKLRILQVLHFGPETLAGMTALGSGIDAVLIDSRTATAVGGTGIAFDWKAARESVFAGDGPLKLIAAGGLNPANVAQAIVMLHPWGVDVASGVELSPGRKDPLKVASFVLHAREAHEATWPLAVTQITSEQTSSECDAWFEGKVREALEEREPGVPNEQVKERFAGRRADAINKGKS